MNLIRNQTKYMLIKEVSLTAEQCYHFTEKWYKNVFNESVIAEKFITTLKSKNYKYDTSVSKSLYIDKLDYIVNKYNNTYHRTIKMKTIDVNLSKYIDFNKENSKEGAKFKVNSSKGSYNKQDSLENSKPSVVQLRCFDYINGGDVK